MKKYIVKLTSEQRQELSRLISAGTAPARQLTPARILLKADQGQEGPAWSDTRMEASAGSQHRHGRAREKTLRPGGRAGSPLV